MKRVIFSLLLLAACGDVPIEDNSGTGTNTLRVEAEFLGWRHAWSSIVFIDGGSADGPGQAPVGDATLKLCGDEERVLGCTKSVKITQEPDDTPGKYEFYQQSWQMEAGEGTTSEDTPMGVRYSIESPQGSFEASIRGIGRIDFREPVTTGDTHTISAGTKVSVAWTVNQEDGGAAPSTLALSTWQEGQSVEGPVTFSELDPGATSGTIMAPSEPGTYTLVIEAGRSIEPAGGLSGSILRAWRRDEVVLEVTP